MLADAYGKGGGYTMSNGDYFFGVFKKFDYLYCGR